MRIEAGRLWKVTKSIGVLPVSRSQNAKVFGTVSSSGRFTLERS